MENKELKTEQDAIDWIKYYIPIAVRTKSKKCKTTLVFPFSSQNAYDVVCNRLGQELFKFMQENYESKTSQKT